MRTTLTIDDSIMQKLKQEAYQRGLPLKQIINTTLKVGLRNLYKQQQNQRYKTITHSMGIPCGINPDKALQIATAIEDDDFKSYNFKGSI